jgi:pimeloyl-ACP methyl ester carboxylesterase
MFAGLVGYEMAPPLCRAGVPIRALNGDLWPTSVERNRTLAPDFDAVIMPDTGHYPMLEQPETFNRLLEGLVAGLGGRA